jgi:hypothetical protein
LMELSMSFIAVSRLLELIFGRIIVKESICKRCPRRSVNHVPGLYNLRGGEYCAKKGVRRTRTPFFALACWKWGLASAP